MTAPASLAERAAWLLGRALVPADGATPAQCEAAGRALGFSLPPALREFHLAVGRMPQFMHGFQRFAAPDEWWLSDGKLVFLEENQGVCHWAADADGRVYQAGDPHGGPWEAEDVDLAEFLRVLLYYQMAQGGYAYCGMRADAQIATAEAADALVAQMGGRRVVEMAGLRIFVVADQVLVWYLHDAQGRLDPGLFLASADAAAFNRWCEQWSFDDLD